MGTRDYASTTVIHTIESAALRADVTPEVIRAWIREGMRATPVGSVGKRGPRDYRIFDCWLLEFMDRRAERAVVKPEPVPAKEPKRAARKSTPRGLPSDNLKEFFGPCPAPKKN